MTYTITIDVADCCSSKCGSQAPSSFAPSLVSSSYHSSYHSLSHAPFASSTTASSGGVTQITLSCCPGLPTLPAILYATLGTSCPIAGTYELVYTSSLIAVPGSAGWEYTDPTACSGFGLDIYTLICFCYDSGPCPGCYLWRVFVEPILIGGGGAFNDCVACGDLPDALVWQGMGATIDCGSCHDPAPTLTLTS